MTLPILIGIAGGTGSGKTTLTKQIARRFGEHVTVIRHDNYYRSHSDLTYEQRAALNFDCPEAFETELLIKHLKQLRKGIAIDSPLYDYTIHNRSTKTEHILPTKVIIVEGILIFADVTLCELMDIKLFVDTDADVRILRRIRRDVRDRGRSLDSVIQQYLQTVKPMHEQYVEPSRKNADLIIPEGGKNLVALEMIFTRIENHIHS
ncbi:MAG: uridine kinase [Eubacteriales bacterium]|nr:uridine kinase [Eubacteriales bacterium]